MKIEWDPLKNEDNIRKHFLDFEDAWEAFEGPMLTEIDDRFDYQEVRTKGIGFLRDIIVVLIFSEPEDGTIRIISLRKATNNERKQFFRFLQDRLGSSSDDV